MMERDIVHVLLHISTSRESSSFKSVPARGLIRYTICYHVMSLDYQSQQNVFHIQFVGNNYDHMLTAFCGNLVGWFLTFHQPFVAYNTGTIRVKYLGAIPSRNAC